MLRRLVASLCVLAFAGVLAACVPGAPSGDPYCGSSPVGPIINNVWHATGVADVEHAYYITWRESRCDPNALNPSGAEGLFQLLGHNDLIFAACPNPWGVIAWNDPTCNARAALLLFQSSGWAPWGG